MSNARQPNGNNQAAPGAPGAEAAALGPEADAAALGPELQEAQRQRDEYFEQLQRARADFVNYQKRAKAKADADRAYAVVPLALDLIAIVDNFERATDAARATAGAEGILKGLEMVHKQMLDTLAKHGIEAIPALGQPFDPNQHEALTQTPSAEYPEGTVVAELGKGYRLHDRVLRPAKVAVSVKPA